jgi:hypothetical protein
VTRQHKIGARVFLLQENAVEEKETDFFPTALLVSETFLLVFFREKLPPDKEFVFHIE